MSPRNDLASQEPASGADIGTQDHNNHNKVDVTILPIPTGGKVPSKKSRDGNSTKEGNKTPPPCTITLSISPAPPGFTLADNTSQPTTGSHAEVPNATSHLLPNNPTPNTDQITPQASLTTPITNTTQEHGNPLGGDLIDPATDDHEPLKKAVIEALRYKHPDESEETIQFFANNTPLDALKTLIELHLRAE